MKIQLRPKETKSLLKTDIIFQTFYWSQVKSRLGWKPSALDIVSSNLMGDILILTKTFGNGIKAAYVPQGPEFAPKQEEYGLFLETISHEIVNHIDPAPAFIRYDLPWKSQYETIEGDARNDWSGHPEARLRELRMNFGTKSWNLRKAVTDFTVADSLHLDLSCSEDEILCRMKPKTRYNIRLSHRKGVEVFPADVGMLHIFYDLYCQTALRNGFPPCDFKHFSALFTALSSKPDTSECHFLLAAHEKTFLAGAIITISGQTATYLYGASSTAKRNLMGSYAIQWAAIKLAKQKGCLIYDMGAVAPSRDSSHPFHRIDRFKSGFGGKVIHRNGSWDYPFSDDGYTSFRNMETIGRAQIR